MTTSSEGPHNPTAHPGAIKEPLRVERTDGGVAIVTLNRPDNLNALNPDLISAIPAALEPLASDRDVRAVVITGAGRGFCAGADLSDSSTDDDMDVFATVRDAHLAAVALYRLPQPTIAAINGPAAGGGLGLALCCDVRVAGHTAVLRAPFVDLGLIPDCGCTLLLEELAGRSLAMDMVLTGRRLDASEALNAGIVSRVVDDALECAVDMATEIAAKPSDTPAAVKAAMRATRGSDLETVLTYHETYVQTRRIETGLAVLRLRTS